MSASWFLLSIKVLCWPLHPLSPIGCFPTYLWAYSFPWEIVLSCSTLRTLYCPCAQDEHPIGTRISLAFLAECCKLALTGIFWLLHAWCQISIVCFLFNHKPNNNASYITKGTGLLESLTFPLPTHWYSPLPSSTATLRLYIKCSTHNIYSSNGAYIKKNDTKFLKVPNVKEVNLHTIFSHHPPVVSTQSFLPE